LAKPGVLKALLGTKLQGIAFLFQSAGYSIGFFKVEICPASWA